MYESPPSNPHERSAWQSLRLRLLQPPRRRPQDWLNLGLGLLFLLLALLHGVPIIWGVLGISYTLGGLAERLPQHWRAVAAVLRVISWLLGVGLIFLFIGLLLGVWL